MKRRLFWLIPLALLLCACSVYRIEDADIPLASPVEPALPARQSMVFLVDAADDPLFREAAKVFCAQVFSLSGETLTVEIRQSLDPLGDYARGAGDFLLLGRRAQGHFSELLDALAEPLRYRDYDAFTMALNSFDMLDFLSSDLIDESDTRLLAAYYGGSRFLVGDRLALSGSSPGATAILQTDSLAAPLLQAFEMHVAFEDNPAARLELLPGAGLVEFTRDELDGIDWSGMDVSVLNIIYDAPPRWLAVRESSYAPLDALHKAAIAEASAYLFPAIDDRLRAEESAAVARMAEQGIIVLRGSTALRAAADTIFREQAEADPWIKYLSDILDGME